ncbi:MAG: hypothetical protein ABI674_07570 [Spartobacteria bacterium]
MIQLFFHRNRSVLLLAVAAAALAFFVSGGAFAAGKAVPVVKQAQAQPAGRLLIVRSANLGTVVVNVQIDGKQTARINFGGSYDEPLSAGPHVITVAPTSSREHAVPNETKLTVQPGQTYKFTAKLSDVSIVLR